MPFPERPTDPTLVLEPLRYLRAIAPAVDDWAYRRVVGYVGWWLAGNDDPPPSPPDPPPGEEDKKAPPPPPPPRPAYPLTELLDALAAWDAEELDAWDIVQVSLATWLTTGSFGT